MFGFLARFTLVFAVAATLVLPGCADLSLPPAKKVFGRNPQLPELPGPEETVRGEDDPPVVTLKVGNTLRERTLGRSDELPADIKIEKTNLYDVPVSSALEAVLAGTDISLAYQTDNFSDRLVTLVNLSGPLPKVVKRICSAAKIFCVARDGSLELKDKQSFIIEMPPIERARTISGAGSSSSDTSSSISTSSTTNTIVEAISQLAGEKAEEDSAGGNVIYTTDVEGQERVSKYLEQLRHGRPLIVLQMYIWEVSLDSDAAAGIKWSDLTTSQFGGNFSKISLTSADALSAVAGGVSMGAVLTGKISAQIVANFLSTQGVVQTLSNPQLTFVSGSSAEFRVGGTRNYVSSVGQLTTVSNTVSGTSTTSNSGVGTNTVSTDKLETGLRIEVNGSYESGVIFSSLAVSITDLIKIDSVSTGSTTLQLPETTNRNFSTVLRVRPGDHILLAGMTSSRDDLTRDRLNVPVVNKLPLRGEDKYQNRELVVLLKPAVVFFADEDAPKENQTKPAPVKTPPASVAPAVSSMKDIPAEPKQKPVPVTPVPPSATIQTQPSKPVIVETRQPYNAPLPSEDDRPLPLLRSTQTSRTQPILPAAPPLPVARSATKVSKGLLQSGFSSAFGAEDQQAPAKNEARRP